MTDKAKLDDLRLTVTTSLQVLGQLKASLDSSTAVQDVNALQLAHDAASLVRAHSTKLSLLMINKPYTPSAISKILRDLTTGPLPALATAVQVCDASVWTKLFRAELHWSVGQLLAKLELLIKEIPVDDDALKNMAAKTEKKAEPPASTGLVWEACDAILGLQKMGVAGFLIGKVEQYRDMIKDALEELQEWGEEESDDDDDDDDDDDVADEYDDMFEAQRHIPKNDTQRFHERLQSSLRRLKLMNIMYQAVTKRRLKTLPAMPAGPETAKCLDEVMKLMKKIPETTDDLASAFYELDSTGIDRYMDECFITGFAVVELLVENWHGEEDGFSQWAHNFQGAIKKE